MSTFPWQMQKSRWFTDPKHFPKNYREISEWNGTYFTRKVLSIGPYTGEVIQRILASSKLKVQTHGMRQGVLSFAKKYSKQVLEETCKQTLELSKVQYTFIKNTIPVVAEEIGAKDYNTSANEQKNKSTLLSWIPLPWTLRRSFSVVKSWCRTSGRRVKSNVYWKGIFQHAPSETG